MITSRNIIRSFYEGTGSLLANPRETTTYFVNNYVQHIAYVRSRQVKDWGTGNMHVVYCSIVDKGVPNQIYQEVLEHFTLKHLVEELI